MIVDGKKIAKDIIDGLRGKQSPKAFLAAIFVGDNAESESFLKQKERTAKELGVDFRLYKLSGDLNRDGLRREIEKIAEHKNCGGVILQLPLPGETSPHYVLNAIPREKDVDVLSERSIGAFYTGRNPVLPPPVGVVEKVIAAAGFDLSKSKAVVVGRGILVGQPIALWLERKVSELQIFASKTENLKDKLREADLVISGVGKADLFEAGDLKRGALVIDFGYDFEGKKVHGDFSLPKEPTEIFYTPTPGGTGPILVAQLFENFYKLNTP